MNVDVLVTCNILPVAQLHHRYAMTYAAMKYYQVLLPTTEYPKKCAPMLVFGSYFCG